ncbi:hypothetical protein ACHAXS_006241 [Conticribra weissflogii]
MEFDYDLVASALESHHQGVGGGDDDDDDNVDFKKLYQSIVGEGDHHHHHHHHPDAHPHLLHSPPMTGFRDPISNGDGKSHTNNINNTNSNNSNNNNSTITTNNDNNMMINFHNQNQSSSSLNSNNSTTASDSPLLHAKYHQRYHPHGLDDDPTFLHSVAAQPNFQFAAPFLSIIANYIERRRVPFEHVDLWVPSFSPQWNPKEPTAPLTSSMGSGSVAKRDMTGAAGGGAGRTTHDESACRLCFAGCATVGVHLVEASDDGTADAVDGGGSASGVDADAAVDNGDAAAASFGNDGSSSSSNEDHSDRNGKYRNMKRLPLSEDQIFNYSLFGSYSEKFSFSSGCGLPGRVYQSGIPAWEQFVMNAPPHLFERRGGAMQSGIKTALGLPICTRTGGGNSGRGGVGNPSIGRMVVVLYSRHDREKDEELVDRLMRDMRMVNPCPRWKLVVDVVPENWSGDGTNNTGNGNESNSNGARNSPGNLNGYVPNDGRCGGLSPPMGLFALNGHRSPRQHSQSLQQQVVGGGRSGMGTPGFSSIQPPQQQQQEQQHPSNPQDPSKETKIQHLITLLGENMPSDPSSPLGQQLHSIMSLRLILLRPRANRTPQEEHTIDTILLLMDSYIAANRTRSDIVLFLARDFAFHSMQMQQQVQHPVPGVGFMQMQQQQLHGRGVLLPYHLSPHPQQQQQPQQPQFVMGNPQSLGQMKNDIQRKQQQQLQQHPQLHPQHMALQKQALTTPIFGPYRG